VLGVLLGHFWPDTGAAMKPLGDGFIKLIKMIIAPIIFCTVVVGIAGMEDMKKVGKTGASRCSISRSSAPSRWWWAWSSSTSCGPVPA
jgi:Na+/H+-dicarboxylate symporter